MREDHKHRDNTKQISKHGDRKLNFSGSATNKNNLHINNAKSNTNSIGANINSGGALSCAHHRSHVIQQPPASPRSKCKQKKNIIKKITTNTDPRSKGEEDNAIIASDEVHADEDLADQFNNISMNITVSETGGDSPSSASDDDQNTCAICITKMDRSTVVQVKSCKHSFCYPCLMQWVEHKALCPICKCLVDVVIHIKEGGASVEEKIPQRLIDQTPLPETLPPPGAPGSGALDCLDHTYFIQEIERLLASARYVAATLRGADSRFRSRLVSSDSDRVGDIIESLTGMRAKYMDCDWHFDPYISLQELYNMQDRLDAITSRAPTTTVFQSRHQRQPQQHIRYFSNSNEYGDDDYDGGDGDEYYEDRYNYYYYYNYEDDDDDDDDDDDYYQPNVKFSYGNGTKRFSSASNISSNNSNRNNSNNNNRGKDRKKG